MAYITQEEKRELAPKIKDVLKKYNTKGTIAIEDNKSLVVNIKSSKLDFLKAQQKVYNECYDGRNTVGTYIQVNEFYAEKNHRTVGENRIADFYKELYNAMKGDNWFDNSDMMIDYHEIAYYIRINVGKWNKPFILEQ